MSGEQVGYLEQLPFLTPAFTFLGWAQNRLSSRHNLTSLLKQCPGGTQSKAPVLGSLPTTAGGSTDVSWSCASSRAGSATSCQRFLSSSPPNTGTGPVLSQRLKGTPLLTSRACSLPLSLPPPLHPARRLHLGSPFL